jgi:disulfide bond formation protein DsbB
MLRPRLIFLAIFLCCACLLGFGYYLQFYKGLEPCPLCIFQRVCYALLGLVSLTAVLHNPARSGVRVYAALSALPTIAGITFAARQTWLQHLPPEQVPACGPGLDYWMKTLPIAETFKKVFRGTGECAAVDWTFLGLSIAEWSLICFTGFLIGLVVSWIRNEEKFHRL